MPVLSVPDHLISGILRIALINQEGFDQLLAALKHAPKCKNKKELLAWMGGETPAITDKDRTDLLSSVIPMIRVQRNADVSVDEFAADVWTSIAESTPDATRDLDKTLFKLRTAQLIAESALDLASLRVDDVKREVERNFCKVKIMTDLRPVFQNNLDEVPSDVAVIHNFQIGYHDGNGVHREFYVSLDSADMESLKRAIADAEKKVHTLERLMATNSVNVYR